MVDLCINIIHLITEIPNTLKFVVIIKVQEENSFTVHPNTVLVFEYMCKSCAFLLRQSHVYCQLYSTKFKENFN